MRAPLAHHRGRNGRSAPLHHTTLRPEHLHDLRLLNPVAACGVIHGEREALTRGPHPGRRDRAEPLARPTRADVRGEAAMRRFLVMAGAAATVAGVAIGMIRSRAASGKGWREWLVATSVGLPSGPLGWVAIREMALEHRAMYATMARELDLRPDDDVLDVGCGSGAFLQRHAAHVRHVAGVDASGIPVGMARRRLADRIAAGTARDRPGRCHGDAVAGRPLQRRHRVRPPRVRPRPLEGPERDAPRPAPRWAGAAHARLPAQGREPVGHEKRLGPLALERGRRATADGGGRLRRGLGLAAADALVLPPARPGHQAGSAYGHGVAETPALVGEAAR